MQTEVLLPSGEGIARAATLLQSGALVAFPTETVYGLGGDASQDGAVAKIYAAKGRPSHNPLIVHVPDLLAAEHVADVSDAARLLARAFWPGPLTLVLPVKAGATIASDLRAGLPTVAVRVPAHPVAQALLRACGRPLAAPSANPSGRISPTQAVHVLDGLSGRIAAVLDGGDCAVGLESTIVGFPEGRATLLRPGGLAAGQIAQVLAEGGFSADLATDTTPAAVSAPGQLASHYAPRAAVVLNATRRPEGALWLGFGPESAGADLSLSQTADVEEAAHNLFAMLRTLDAQTVPGQTIAVAPIPEQGLGQAVNDRLRRAAAPRG